MAEAVTGGGIMCRIPGTWHDWNWTSLLKNSASIEKRKILGRGCRASHCWRFAPVTVEQSCQWLLKNHASHCWKIVPVTVKQACQWLLNNRASDCWIIVPATVEQSCHPLMKIHSSDCWIIEIFSFFYAGRILQQWCSLLKNSAMYQEYDTDPWRCFAEKGVL